MGETGCGKTSLINLIPRFYEPTEGQIRIDGIPVEQLKLYDLRKQIGLATQDVLLYSDTIEGNIAYGDDSIKMNEVVKFARYSAAADFISKMPEGYDTLVGERGVGLSGGQKQRVAIARVLASDPQILLCDEATSALDPQTTKAILELIKEINRDYGITVVVITHEMSVVQEICDKVAVLERGSLVETGTVEELFRNPKTDEARKLVFSGRTQIKEMKGKRLVRVTFREKSSFEPVIANLVLTYRTPVNILYADTKNINGQAQGEMILQLPELEEVADKMIQYLKEINMGVEELKEDVG